MLGPSKNNPSGTGRDDHGVTEPYRFGNLVCAALRGEDSKWPQEWGKEQGKHFVEQIFFHGIGPLLYYKLHSRHAWSTWPTCVREALANEGRREAACEMLRRREVVRVLEELSSNGLHPVLMKGAPLSYTHYPAPDLRPRGDTDMLLPPSEIETSLKLLDGLGYEKTLSIPGDAILNQLSVAGVDDHGMRHIFDIHWKVTNAQAVANVLTHTDLMQHAQRVPALGPNALAPKDSQALMLACVHQVAHHNSSNRLIWLYDIHLLASAMDSIQWQDFLFAALDKRVAEICLRTLRSATTALGTSLPDDLLQTLAEELERRETEPSRALLAARYRIDRLCSDFTATEGLLNKIRLVRENALPPPSYLLERYGAYSRALLPWLYIRRIVEALPKLFHRT